MVDILNTDLGFVDRVRSTAPVTFMINMLYACSILYKYKLPFIVAINKLSTTSMLWSG